MTRNQKIWIMNAVSPTLAVLMFFWGLSIGLNNSGATQSDRAYAASYTIYLNCLGVGLESIDAAATNRALLIYMDCTSKSFKYLKSTKVLK